MNNKRSLMISILGIIGIIIITAGVTYAFFNYTKDGTTENSITSGTITFLYTEVSGVGKGISIDDAYPISDSQGKVQTGEGKVFDFKVTSTTPSNSSIPYEVTARKKTDSTLDEDAVKLYLTKVTGIDEEEVLLDNYGNLVQTTKVDVSKYTEKTIFQGKVPANSTNYEQAFRLRMWVDEDTDFSDGSMNGKTFTIMVNVYANGKVVTAEEIALESNANISRLTVAATELTPVTDQDYDYETSLPEGTTSTTIDVETESSNAVVTVERVDSLAYSGSNVRRLSTTKTVDLVDGDNYFKITVTSENKEVENEYKVNIKVGQAGLLLSDAIFNKYSTIYESPTLTSSSNNTSDASGLYKSTETNSGNPTYYFRGNVTNNYVSFAGQIWRVVRINEDGTIRLIMQDGINNNADYVFNSSNNNKSYMYYTNSNAKTQLESWYETNIASNDSYASKVASGDYFCEQAKVAYSSSYASNSGTSMTVYSSYTPDFKCSADENSYGIVNSNIGLITYDEVAYAGGYYNKSNSSYYLYNNTYYLTMSPTGFSGFYAYEWNVNPTGNISYGNVYDATRLRAVINLKANVAVTGTGTSTDPWIIQ